MDPSAWVITMTAFVIIAAIAMCIQAGMLIGIYRTIRQMQERVMPLLPKVEGLVEAARTTVDQSRLQLVEMTGKANDILDSTKAQMRKVEEVVDDATSRAKIQLERVEMVMDDTLSRTHETVVAVNAGILKPLREINGIAIGIKTAFAYLSRGGRPNVAEATSDEEMFI
jgi:flagellar biosynthesis protein FliQ